MKIIAFTGAGISKQSGIATFTEIPDVREKLFRSYARNHHEQYNEMIKGLKNSMATAQPNEAHLSLARFHVPVITMNIDGLHQKAGSVALELHGSLPDDDEMDVAWSLENKPVLYGDPAPNYQKAYEMVYALSPDDYFLVIGCSTYTSIAVELRKVAQIKKAKVIEIQDDAAHQVPQLLESLAQNKI